MPRFAGAGRIVACAATPECNPTPEKETGALIVFCKTSLGNQVHCSYGWRKVYEATAQCSIHSLQRDETWPRAERRNSAHTAFLANKYLFIIRKRAPRWGPFRLKRVSFSSPGDAGRPGFRSGRPLRPAVPRRPARTEPAVAGARDAEVAAGFRPRARSSG